MFSTGTGSTGSAAACAMKASRSRARARSGFVTACAVTLTAAPFLTGLGDVPGQPASQRFAGGHLDDLRGERLPPAGLLAAGVLHPCANGRVTVPHRMERPAAGSSGAAGPNSIAPRTPGRPPHSPDQSANVARQAPICDALDVADAHPAGRINVVHRLASPRGPSSVGRYPPPASRATGRSAPTGDLHMIVLLSFTFEGPSRLVRTEGRNFRKPSGSRRTVCHGPHTTACVRDLHIKYEEMLCGSGHNGEF